VKRLSLIDTIVEEIKGRVITGEYKSGNLLGSQDELARTFGVSRASLREALKRLELMGLVESRQGLGTFLKKIEPCDFMNPLSSRSSSSTRGRLSSCSRHGCTSRGLWRHWRLRMPPMRI